MLRLAAYGATVAALGGLHLGGWLALAGPAALDGLVGELESPLLPAGAALAVVQLLQLEGAPWVLAAAGWWLVVRERGPAGAAWFGLAAAAAPLYGLHQGTFVGVARPAEPFVAAFAALALVRLAEAITAWGPGRGRPNARLRHLALAAGAAATLSIPAWHSARQLFWPATVDPAGVVARIAQASPPDAEVLAPPYYAALAGRRMLFDYADWTVWGMRAAAGVEHERRLAAAAAALVDAGALPLVAADFRLAYVAPVRDALARRYVLAATDGDVPARSVAFFVPR